jgi:hypothetical protein
MYKFQKQYFALTLVLFLIEIFIALFARDQVIRPYGGDLLVVILLFCLIKSVINFPVTLTALGVLLFSYLVETLQFFNVVNHIGLANSKTANILIGNSFSWLDILAYTLGILLVLGIEKSQFSKTRKRIRYGFFCR